MLLEGTVRNGVIVPDDRSAFAEGTRVKLEVVPSELSRPNGFRDRYGDLVVDAPDAPTDLAEQLDHYRLGTPKR